MPRLALGNHPTIVYPFKVMDKDFNPISSSIKRYDVRIATVSVIASFSHLTVEGAQVSADGGWVLFNALSSTHPITLTY
jgi:hypothetical protein